MPARSASALRQAREFDWIVGINIRFWRELKEISQAELAEFANISDSQLSRIESGDRSVSFQQMLAISELLGVPLRAFKQQPGGIRTVA
jgi:transcriptional regulator with XRE-family HTH domain